MMSPSRSRLLALGIALVLLGAASGHADPVAVDAKTVVTAPDWAVGSDWYYSDGYALKVTSATPGSTVFDRLDAPGQWFSRQGFLRKDLTSATSTRTSVFRTIPDQAGMVLRAGSPLTFQREYLENGVLMVHASSWSVEGRETITVPAGTFDCWVIVWRSRSLRSDWTGFERWWYSPQAQNYVRMEYKYGPDAEGSRVLMRYEIGAHTAQNSIPLAPSMSAPPAPRKIGQAEAPSLPASGDAAQARLSGADAAPIAPPAAPIMSVASGGAAARIAPAQSLSAPAANAEAAEPPPAKGAHVWHAQVASSKEEVAVTKSLQKILLAHGEMLKDVPSGIAAARIANRGVFYRAWLGNFDRSADAIALCRTLRAAGAACSVSKSSREDGQKLASEL